MTLLIDADYLIYNSCCACEQDTRWNEWEHTLHTDERDIMNLIENRLAFYQSVAGSKHDVVMCFSSYPTFATASDGSFTQATFFKNPKTFVTQVGLYNDAGDMVAVANLSTPLKKNFSSEAIVKVRLTY